MTSDRVIRAALWLSVALNLFGVVLFLGPAVGRPSSLIPLEPPPFYAAQLAWVIGLFAVAYGWLAVQPEIDRPLLAVGAAGKIGFFTVSLLFWLAGHLTLQQALQASPDLLLGGVFGWWLLSTR